ncbi:MAG: hypothetical protein JWR26_4873 [Pedosphaera sp.]|nr:hypothetical protein [Pedosphaera sp.]
MKQFLSVCLVAMLLGAVRFALGQDQDPSSTTNQSQNQMTNQSQTQPPSQTPTPQTPPQSQSQTQTNPPATVVSEAVTIKGTVQKIDAKKGLITLKGPEGNTVRLNLGPGAQNLDKLHKGDEVTATYYESAAVMLAKPGEEPTGRAQEDYSVVPSKESQPGEMVVHSVRATATVEDVDPKKRRVTLKEADGSTVKLKVDESVKNLDQIKKGDQIVVRYTEAAALRVTKPRA